MNIKFKPFGASKEQLDDLIKLGLKYDKRQKKQILSASKAKFPTEQDLDEFENLIKSPLPPDFRNFLLTQNGGTPDKSTITVNGNDRVVQKIYALVNESKIYTLTHLISVYKNRVPAGMLPFGDDPAGNLYLIRLDPGEFYGKIYFWDHENEADTEEQPFYENIYFIANSFYEFLKKLQN